MNREWMRVPVARFCGYCGTKRSIAKGEPALFVNLAGVKRQLVRCRDCAGEEPPDDLPELPQHASIEDRKSNNAPGREWMPYRESGEEGA